VAGAPFRFLKTLEPSQVKELGLALFYLLLPAAHFAHHVFDILLAVKVRSSRAAIHARSAAISSANLRNLIARLLSSITPA